MNTKLTKQIAALLLIIMMSGGITYQPSNAFQAEDELVPIRANDDLAARPTAGIWQNVDPDRNLIDYTNDETATFQQLCDGEFALLATSQLVTPEEITECGDVLEMMVAIDGAVFIASPGVDFTTCLTDREIYSIWGAGGETRWNNVNEDYPDRLVSAYTPNLSDDTEAFIETRYLSEVGGFRDNTFLLGTDQARNIEARQSAVGFVSLVDYLANPDSFNPLSLDIGAGCAEPTIENFADRIYHTSAPVYWYALADSPWLENENFINLVQFALSDGGRKAVVAAESTPPPLDYTIRSITNFNNRIAGPNISDPSSVMNDMTIRLTWPSNHDLDLGVQLPNGDYVSFVNPSQSGVYRVASLGNEHCDNVSSNASEEIIFSAGTAVVNETYFAFVQQSFKCNAAEDAASFTLEFIVDGQVVKSISNTVEGEANIVEGYTYTGSEG